MDSLWAADGSVSKSRCAEPDGAACDGELNDDDETEDLMVMKDSVFRTFACAVTTVAACNAKPSEAGET